ncbi:hypothetical protein [Salinibacterium sp. ZJ77]|uniref:hypothetical protein n=1 Tax=Salinibacterium sp. ZJ77 TaxID=2708337 RepID=UPI00141D88CF|nr:hypothetical protein [Salinibacterium sp. ZJ77]
MTPDYEIPVSYVTDAGSKVSCTIELFAGEVNYVETNTEAMKYFSSQNWDGVGQRIYERALSLESDGVSRAWFPAMYDVLLANTDDGLFSNGGMATDTDCSGELH